MGLNFYGYDFTKPETAKKNSRPTNIKAVMGDEFLRMLKRQKPKLVWQEQHAEHRGKYKVSCMLYASFGSCVAVLACHMVHDVAAVAAASRQPVELFLLYHRCSTADLVCYMCTALS